MKIYLIIQISDFLILYKTHIVHFGLGKCMKNPALQTRGNILMVKKLSNKIWVDVKNVMWIAMHISL
jgi:hypothetical protein